MVRIWKETPLVHPARTPELMGVGVRVNGEGNPVLWALTWCCWAMPVPDESLSRWVCSQCHDTIRREDMELTAGFEIWSVHVLEDYRRAREWVSAWTGVPKDQVVVSVKWERSV